MSKLVESILENDFVSAHAIFEERIADIAEKKLYEKRRMIQAEAAGGGLTKAEIAAREKAGYQPAHKVLGDPAAGRRTGAAKNLPTGKGAGDDVATHLQRLGKEWKAAKFGERKKAIQMVRQAAKQFHAGERPSATTTTTPAQPSSVSDTQRGFPAQLKREPEKGLKKLSKKPSPVLQGRQMGGMERYERDLQKAKGLEARGSKTAVSRVQKAYRGVRAKSALGNVARGVGRFVAGALQSVEE